MRVEVMQHFGLAVPFEQAGYYERAHPSALIEQIRGAITAGRLVAVCGAIGSGKTVLLRRLQQILKEEDKITVSTSFALEKHRVGRSEFITALWYDVSTKTPARIPSGEKRERDLREWVRKHQKPVALFIDDAHELTRRALIELWQLMTLIESDGGRLSVVLAGQPTLRKALRHATRREFGHRTEVFALERNIAASGLDVSTRVSRPIITVPSIDDARARDP